MNRFSMQLATALLAAPTASLAADPVTIQQHNPGQLEFNALTDAPVGGQLSRFDWAICPAAVGLPDAQNRVVAARLRQVARAVGLKASGATCRPNALVIVADDKDKFLSAFRLQYPTYFTDAGGRPMRIPRGNRAVTAWHVEGPMDSNGQTHTMRRSDGGGKYLVVTSYDSARLLPASRSRLLAGIVVVERRALAGLTTTQLADYAAMRILARTDPVRLAASKAPTILTVVDAPMGTATPITITAWDLGFLKSLYASGERQYASRQRHEMQRFLRKELDRSPRQRDERAELQRVKGIHPAK